MNIYWMLLWEKSKDLWLPCRPFRITSTQSGLLHGSPTSPAVYWLGEFQLAWFRKLPRWERSKISSLWQITSGRHSLKSASLSPVLVDDDRTPAGLAWIWPPTSSHCPHAAHAVSPQKCYSPWLARGCDILRHGLGPSALLPLGGPSLPFALTLTMFSPWAGSLWMGDSGIATHWKPTHLLKPSLNTIFL